MCCHTGPSDCLGRRLRVGDRVRVVAKPGLFGLGEPAQAAFERAFAVLRRRPRLIRAFDARGNAELAVRLDGDLQILMLEPGLLEWTPP